MGLLSRLFRLGQPSSSDVAKDRLQVVLIHDRVRISPAQMAALREDLLAVVSRYFDVDADGVEITFSQDKRENRLVAEMPVLTGARRSQGH